MPNASHTQPATTPATFRATTAPLRRKRRLFIAGAWPVRRIGPMLGPMNTYLHLVETRPLIALHLTTALLALLVGIVVMLRRKGNFNHKVAGWAWVGLMAVTAVASVFIRDYGMPNIAGYTPIHLFTIAVAINVPLGIVSIRRRRVEAHRKFMTRTFYGACVIAGIFTLLPGRYLGDLLWKQTLGLVA